jgi:peptidoglycan/xylan/chitin deacetylase (PgdA/CDA1 family)
MLSSCTVLQPSKENYADRTVVLTFDDGPNPHADVTRRLLGVLARHNVKAFHCVIGQYADENPDLMSAYVDAGHILVNHGYEHPFPLFTMPWSLYDDYARCEAVLAGYPNPDGRKYVRPPYGLITGTVSKFAEDHGATIVPITFYFNDAQNGPKDADAILDKYLRNIRRHSGGIVLIHEGRWPLGGGNVDHKRDSPSSGYNRSWVPDLVDKLITTLKAEGYEFSTEIGHQ